jgi:peptidoglycan-N-acetylglucosamine deacetylase
MKTIVKRIALRTLLLITIIGCIGIVYSLAYTYSANASKLPSQIEIKPVNSTVTIDQPTQIVIKNPQKEELPPETVPTVTVDERNQINNEGISCDNALIDDGKKTAFLTFDDGPSLTVTPLILDILKKYNINGTFFLIGQSVDSNEQSKNIVKQMFKDGHAIGNHTYTHNLKKLYPNNKVDVPYFMSELEKNKKSLETVLGSDFNTKLIRMPGGIMTRSYYKDPNLDLLLSEFDKNNMHTIDWNASILDSEGGKKILLNCLKL